MHSETKSEKLQSLLYMDDLTQIFNRRYLSEQVPQMLVQAKKKDQTIAFFMIDMDKFKNINDTYGHQAGDDALVHFSRILVEKINPEGTAIRFAGDEFVLLVPGLDKQKARDLGTEIQQKIKDSPLKVGDKQLTLSCSAGVSLYPKDGKTWKILFKKADEALYAAKQWGRGRIIPYPDAGKFMTPAKLDSILAAPPIVGRDEIVQFLDKQFSKKGNPSIFPVFLGGDGAGKTRLIKYVEEIAREKVAFILLAKGYPFWQTEKYGSIFAALGSLFESDQQISDYVFSKLDDKDKLVLKPNLYPWEVKEVKGEKEDMEFGSSALFAALTQTFFILREIGDGVVLLDDADLIDIPSLQLLDSQFKAENDNRLFFVSSVNSPDLASGEENMMLLLDSMPDVISNSKVKKYELNPLNLEHINTLSTKLFDGKTLTTESTETLLRSSAGNPLFIVETLSYLLQKGKIEAKGYEWDLSSVKPKDIPLSLSDLIEQRLMLMDKEAINTLKLASILGEKINPQQLADMSKLKEQQVLNILGKARRLLIIEETPIPDEFIFAHRMGRSVLYSLMSEKERTNYHNLAAEIEKKYAAGSLERVVGRLAYHLQNSGQMGRATEMFAAMRNQMEEVYLSKGSREALQKKLYIESTAKELPLKDEDLAAAQKFAGALRMALQNLRLFPMENRNVMNAVKRFMDYLNSFLTDKTEALSVSLTPETMLLNGQPVPAKHIDPRLRNELYTTLSNYGLQGILFIRGVTQDELVRFLEIFTRPHEDVINRWDELVEQLELSNILPDRKIFVAVGERKVFLDGQEVYARDPQKEDHGTQAQADPDAPGITDKQLEKLRNIVTKFTKEKEDLLLAIKSSNVGQQDFQKLIDLMDKTDMAKLEKVVLEPGKSAPQVDKIADKKDRYTDVLPDLQIIKKAEEEMSLALDDLHSQDSETRAKAAAWLMNQDPKKLAAAGLNAIISTMPFRTKLLVAAIIRKAGTPAVDAFLEKIHSGMSSTPLSKVIKVADMFLDSPKLIPVLREIVLLGPDETVLPAAEILKQIPGKKVNSILLELFVQIKGKAKQDILTIFADRKMTEAIPTLLKIIRPKKSWKKEKDISLQAHTCRTLGIMGSEIAIESLIAVVSPAGGVFARAKPNSVRVAATWALKKFPNNEKAQEVLTKLKTDKSPHVRKAATL
jgi:diguanylate cyclase (GGDEF)-like protein